MLLYFPCMQLIADHILEGHQHFIIYFSYNTCHICSHYSYELVDRDNLLDRSDSSLSAGFDSPTVKLVSCFNGLESMDVLLIFLFVQLNLAISDLTLARYLY